MLVSELLLVCAAATVANNALHPTTSTGTPTRHPPASNSTLHFVYLGLWGGHKPPPAFAANFKHFQAQNPERNVVLWTGAMVNALVDAHLSPGEKVLYDSAAPIQKADLARYLVVLAKGGWYLDMDVGVDCAADHSLQTRTKAAVGGIAAACTNVVATLEKAVGLRYETHSAGLFWEQRPLTYQEQMESVQRPVSAITHPPAPVLQILPVLSGTSFLIVN